MTLHICAWCGCTLNTSGEVTAGVSHGICESCMEKLGYVHVLETDQWSSTGDVTKKDFLSVVRDQHTVDGGDADAARKLCIAKFVYRTVSVDAHPSKGSVWFRKGPDGKCLRWKANYDSSG